MTRSSGIIVRKATATDIDSVAGIYMLIHRLEKLGTITVGWDPQVYPVRATAEEALRNDSLFVMTSGSGIVASAIINSEQPEAYRLIDWEYPASDSEVGVLHTLTVNPHQSHKGFGRAFVAYFEAYARSNGCTITRLDTQVRNEAAFRMYPRLGYRLAGIRETRFQNLPAPVALAMFEKPLR